MRPVKRVIIFLGLLALAACGGQAEEPAAAPEQEQPAPTSPPALPTATLPPPVVVGGLEGEETPTDENETTGAAGPIDPWPAGDFGYGIQSHAVVGDPAFVMDVVRNQLGLDWIKVQLEWPLVYPEPGAAQWFFYDGIVEQANAQGLRLMFSVVGAPSWTRSAGTENGPPDDFSQYSAFLSELLQRYPGQIHAVEVWNEQNIDREWSTVEGLSAASYVDLLARANAVIKSHDPNIIVISGALAPTGVHDETSNDDFIYLDQALAAGLLDHADCVGVHHNGYNIGPDVAFDQTGSVPEASTAFFRGPFDNVHHSWSFKTTLDTYAQKVQAVDPGKKLCVTEFGWASSEGYDEYPQDFGHALDNTLEEQAEFIVQAFQQMRESGDVWLAFLFNFDFGNKGGGPTDDPVPYSIVDTQGIPRPAFGALAAMEKPR